MPSDGDTARTVHVLLRQESQYVETSNDAVSTSAMVLVDVFATKADAKAYLDAEVREPLHRNYEIEEKEIRSNE